MTVADAVQLKEELTKAIDDAEKDNREELTEFESGLFSAFSDGWQQYLGGEEVNVVEWAKEHSTELLVLAKQQLLQSGELLTQEHHEKLMDTLREECTKDLPRWKRIKAFDKLPCRAYLYNLAYERENNCWGRATIHGLLMPNEAVQVGCDTWYLPVDDIQNLPKEDSHD